LLPVLERVTKIKECVMKNTIKIMGLLLFAAIIGFSFAACKDDSAKDELDGTTWKASQAFDGGTIDYVIKCNSPNFTMTVTQTITGEGQIGPQTTSGKYSISGSTVTITMTNPSTGETQTQTGTLSGKTLTVGSMTFTKQ
jgi:hypothetical protein